MREAREVFKAGADGIARTHLLVNPMVHQTKRFRDVEPREAQPPQIEKLAGEFFPGQGEPEKVQTEDVPESVSSEAAPEEEKQEEKAEEKPLELPAKKKKNNLL